MLLWFFLCGNLFQPYRILGVGIVLHPEAVLLHKVEVQPPEARVALVERWGTSSGAKRFRGSSELKSSQACRFLRCTWHSMFVEVNVTSMPGVGGGGQPLSQFGVHCFPLPEGIARLAKAIVATYHRSIQCSLAELWRLFSNNIGKGRCKNMRRCSNEFPKHASEIWIGAFWMRTFPWEQGVG